MSENVNARRIQAIRSLVRFEDKRTDLKLVTVTLPNSTFDFYISFVNANKKKIIKNP